MGKKKQKKNKSDFNKSKVIGSEENFYETAIKELSFVTKSNGLVMGTNETLRRLERGELAGVFLFSQKASPSIYHSLSLLCRKNDVPFITMQDKDKFVLGSKFPTSITYGVKKECVNNLPALDKLLNGIRSSKKNKKSPAIVCDTAFKTTEQSIKENELSHELDSHSFYHKKHAGGKKGNSEWTDKNFLSFSESTITFPDYDSLFKSCDFSFSTK